MAKLNQIGKSSKFWAFLGNHYQEGITSKLFCVSWFNKFYAKE